MVCVMTASTVDSESSLNKEMATVRQIVIVHLAILVAWFTLGVDCVAPAQEPEWIWSQEHTKDSIPIENCYFRKAFQMRSPEAGKISIWCDDIYTLYVNGHHVAEGRSWEKPDQHEISGHLAPGRNVVAIEVQNTEGSTAGLAARLTVKERGNTHVSLSTDKTWKASKSALPFWQMPSYSDRRWKNAQSFGPFDATPPGVMKKTEPTSSRFQISREFEVRELIGNDQCGSVIAMVFDEFGRILLSRENEGLFMAIDTNEDGFHDSIKTYSDKVKNCQGILPLNGQVLVLAEGPEGRALYRLSDANRDGNLEEVRTVLKFHGDSIEHGPHGITLGPDGLVYIVLGNHTRSLKQYSTLSPYRHSYEGLLAQPKYEDPGGHARGVTAPGGSVIRTDPRGKKVELVAGGLRNAYDLAFDRRGELFTHDSDMEFDEGTPWQRPTRLLHVIPGAEFGWRSGSAKWPDYFVDVLPAVVETDRGSPTGIIFYDHHAFPVRYHNALFSCDWAQGRIMVFRLKPAGTSYTATSEVFLAGQPLNVTDIDVGPDGALYFSTGGRGTHGGIYRVSWKGVVPESAKKLGSGITAAIRQPQLNSALSRQTTAFLQTQIGSDWRKQLTRVARNTQNPSHYRWQALHLMQLLGPSPSKLLLLEMSTDSNPDVRSAATFYMGVRYQAGFLSRLGELAEDSDPQVRRQACESLVRANAIVPFSKLKRSLSSADRFEAWAARRLLERIPSDQWREEVLLENDHRLFIQGAVALMIVDPTRSNALDVSARIAEIIPTYINDRDFTDMLRVQQLALLRGALKPNDIPQLRNQLAEEFPAGEVKMNREVVRLLSYLQVGSCMDRFIQYLQSDANAIETLHLAIHLRYLEAGWTSQAKIEVLKYFDRALCQPHGKNYTRYIEKISQDFAASLNKEERRQVLSNGAEWPNSCFVVLYGMADKNVDKTVLGAVRDVDEQVRGNDTQVARRLKTAVVAVLARSGDDDSLAYLRKIFDTEPDRRVEVALGLAEHPNNENWPYLVRSLHLVEGAVAADIMRTLTRINRVPEKPETIRLVILQSLQQDTAGRRQALDLLKHWTGEMITVEGQDSQQAVERWQHWFSEKYPDRIAATLPESGDDSKWNLNELLTALSQPDGLAGSATHGKEVFNKAQCGKCHRYGDFGGNMGPDLSSVSNRFHKKEILEAIIHPSQVIPDQYSSKTVVTKSGRTHTGIIAVSGGDELVLHDADGERISIREEDVDEVLPSKTSAMPEGLLDSLTLQEIVDLFAYLGVPPRSTVSTRRGKQLR